MNRIFNGALAVAMLGFVAFGYWSGVSAEGHVDAGVVSAQRHEVTGVIQAIDDTSVTIDGTLYQITDQTQKEGALQVGDTASLEYITNSDGSLTVQEISSETELDAEDSSDEESLDAGDNNNQGEDLDQNEQDDESLQQGASQGREMDGEHEQESEFTGSDD